MRPCPCLGGVTQSAHPLRGEVPPWLVPWGRGASWIPSGFVWTLRCGARPILLFGQSSASCGSGPRRARKSKLPPVWLLTQQIAAGATGGPRQRRGDAGPVPHFVGTAPCTALLTVPSGWGARCHRPPRSGGHHDRVVCPIGRSPPLSPEAGRSPDAGHLCKVSGVLGGCSPAEPLSLEPLSREGTGWASEGHSHPTQRAALYR